MVILVVGGSGGIGFAITEALLNKYPDATVYATFHSSLPMLTDRRLSWLKLDIASVEAIGMLASELGQIDILINAVGLLHDEDNRPEKSLKEFDPEFFQKNIVLNTRSSILLAKHFATHLCNPTPAFFITISARVGSIEDNRLGGWISYRVSKAALNMALKTISIEWQRTVPNCCVMAFHPGTNDTELSKPFQRNVPKGKLQTPEFTAIALLDLMDTLSAEQTGRFYSYDGSEIPW